MIYIMSDQINRDGLYTNWQNWKEIVKNIAQKVRDKFSLKNWKAVYVESSIKMPTIFKRILQGLLETAELRDKSFCGYWQEILCSPHPI